MIKIVLIFLALATQVNAQQSPLPFFDAQDPTGIFQNYAEGYSYEYFQLTPDLQYFGGTVGENCVLLGDTFCNAVQFIESSNGLVTDEYVFIELLGNTTCSNEVDPLGNLDLGTPQGLQDLLDGCLAIAERTGEWPYYGITPPEPTPTSTDLVRLAESAEAFVLSWYFALGFGLVLAVFILFPTRQRYDY